MTIHVFKLKSERRGQHVHTTVFAGNEGQTLANTGTLVMNIGEWVEFGALLMLGAGSMLNRVVVRFEGDEEVVSND